MSLEIPPFLIGFALSSLTGLPDNYIERLFRGNRDVVSIFYLGTGSGGLLLTIADLPTFLKENHISYFWFFLPFAIAVTVWIIKSWKDRIQGPNGYGYWLIFGIVVAIVTLIGIMVFIFSWTITFYGNGQT